MHAQGRPHLDTATVSLLIDQDVLAVEGHIIVMCHYFRTNANSFFDCKIHPLRRDCIITIDQDVLAVEGVALNTFGVSPSSRWRGRMPRSK